MTGERITARSCWGLDEMLVGKTIAAAQFEDESIALRFADGTWLYLEYDGDEDGVACGINAVPTPFQLEEIGVIDRDEMIAMAAERDAVEEAKRIEAERAEFERLKAKYGSGR